MSEVQDLREEIQGLKESIEKIEDAVTKDQPNRYLDILKNNQPTKPVKEIVGDAKKGAAPNGVSTTQVNAILTDHGYDYTMQGTRGVMERIANKFPKARYKSKPGPKGAKLIWDPNKEDY